MSTPIKSSPELIYLGNRRWTRFPNSDKQLIELDSSYAVVYHSKKSEVVRVMTKFFVRDFSLSELLPKGGSNFSYLKNLHSALRSLGLTVVEFYTDDSFFAQYLNQRTPTVGREKKFLQKMTKPTIAAYSKFSVGGERQLSQISSLSSDSYRVEKSTHGIQWNILSSQKEEQNVSNK